MQRLLVVLAMLVVSAAWLSGCCASPAAVVPPYEPTMRATPGLVGGDQSGGVAAPTPSRVGEGLAPTPTCTPLREDDSTTPTPAQGTPEATLPYEGRRAVQMAKEDLARRSQLPISEILVISVQAVDWPDTSLGCPQPGMMYAQVITPGYLIVLGAKGQTYQYHSGEGPFVVLCADQGTPSVPLIPADKDDIHDGDPWLPVH